MDETTRSTAQRIENLARSGYAYLFESFESTICEHSAGSLADAQECTNFAFIQCVLLAASVDRGRQSNMPVVTHCQGGPFGVAGGPRSVVYWLSLIVDGRRFPDPEGTTLLVSYWQARRQGRGDQIVSRSTVTGFSDSHEGIPKLLDPIDPVVEIEHALIAPGLTGRAPYDAAILPHQAYATIVGAIGVPAESWDEDTEQFLSYLHAWSKVAPVVPLSSCTDHRTRSGWVFLERLLDSLDASPKPDRIIALIRSQTLVCQEIRRIATYRDFYGPGLPFFNRIARLDLQLHGTASH